MKMQRRNPAETQRGELSFAPSGLGDLASNVPASTNPIWAKDNSPGQRSGKVAYPFNPSPERAEEPELPEGWRWAALSEVVVKAKQTNPLAEPESEFTYVDVSSISRDHLSVKETSRILGKDAPSRARKLISAGDVIFATVRPSLRRVALVPPELHGQVCSTAFCVIRAKPHVADPGFLFFATVFEDFVKRVSEHQRGSSYPAVTDGQVLAERIPVPPLPEQRAIAAVLRTVQEAKEACERVLAATRQLKQSLLHCLFAYGPIPLAHAAHVPLKETEIGEIPEGWEVVRLAELIDIKHGYAFKGEFFAPSGKYVLLTPGHFHEGGGFRDQRDKTKYYTGEFPGDYLLQKDDLLVAMTEQTSGLLGSAIMVPESGKFLHNQRLGLILNLNESRLDKLFLYYWFAKPDIRSQIEQTATGTKVHHTSPGRIRDLLVVLPGIGEQREIAAQLAAVDAKLAAEESRRSALSALFQALLHHLMTGQVRLPEFAERG